MVTPYINQITNRLPAFVCNPLFTKSYNLILNKTLINYRIINCPGVHEASGWQQSLQHCSHTSQLIRALVTGIWQEPLPEPAQAAEFCVFPWTYVTCEHTWMPAILFTYTAANILSRKSLQAVDTLGGSIQKPHWFSGRGLFVPEPPVISCL